MKFQDITHHQKKKYIINTTGKHIFYFKNKSGNLTFSIKSSRAEVFIFGLYTGKNKDNFQLTTLQHHQQPNSKSHLLIKGIFNNQSTFNYQGKIKVEKKAKKTKASLLNQNLLLSSQAKITTLPQLEILPQEVKCSHAATITNLNQDQLNFLKSRGVSTKKAKELLIQGFINELKDEVRKYHS
jgi:Fe-S cluster assembly protein SufD